MKNFLFLILGLAVIIGSVFLFLRQPIAGENKIKVIKIGDFNVRAEVVSTPEIRERGLSGRESLKEGTGMLFVFERPGQYGLWMKEMKFPIDILWIDQNFRVNHIIKNLSPETYPQVFYPEEEAQYVLELPSGAVDYYQIATGTVVQF